MKLDIPQVQETVNGMTETLIRQKILYPYRLMDIYFVVAIDGTGVLVFQERHCPYCLTKTHDGKTLYYHSCPGGKADNTKWLCLLSDDRVYRESR